MSFGSRLPGIYLLLVAGVFGACQQAAPEVPTFVSTDSAGVRIVVNERPSWSETEAWSLSEEPRFQIGVLEGDQRLQFAGVLGATKMTNGHIVVLDGGSAQLRFFDASGHILAAVGRSGQGPGEFNRPTGLVRTTHDSLLVSAYHELETSRFTPEGEFVRLDRLDGTRHVQALGTLWGCPGNTGLLADGSYLACAGEGVPRHQHPEAPRASHWLVRTPYDVAWADTLGLIYGIAGYRLAFGAGGTKIASGGDPLRIYVGDPAFYQIDVFGDRTGRQLSIRYPNGLRPVTEQDRSTYMARDAEFRASPPPLPNLPAGEVVRIAPPPDHFSSTMPGFVSLHYDAAGYVWAVEYQAPGSTGASALVFTDGGELLGRVELPRGFTIAEIGEDYVLGVWRDEFGVEFVREYELLRA